MSTVGLDGPRRDAVELAAVALGDDETLAATTLTDAELRSAFAWAMHRYRQASGRPGHAMTHPSGARFVELEHEYLRRFPGADISKIDFVGTKVTRHEGSR